MGFLDRLLGREKKAEDMPAEPQMRSEGTQPETSGMAEPPPEPAEGMTQEPRTQGAPPERETP
jgi:hypothetical protein